MQIIEINQRNFDNWKNDLITLNDAFLHELEIYKFRQEEEKIAILQNMIHEGLPTHLLIITDNNETLGMCYFNTGTGYSCGGDYIWLNGIYIKPEAQHKGYGTALINYIIEWAKDRKYTQILSSRDLDNNASERLFERCQFQQSENVWIVKKL